MCHTASMSRTGQTLEPADALPRRKYVLLISGTMNPPHIGHVRLGLNAAEHLRSGGHVVTAICFLPVHDNYLCNKVSAKQSTVETLSVEDTIAFPMSERCEALRMLLKGEPAEQTRICHVLDYEHGADSALLAESPGYWAPKLPEGYLKTVPTTAVIAHFASHSPLMDKDARLGMVFGVDNLAGMATWNDPGALLAQGDLVLLARAMPAVKMSRDPSELLGALQHLEIRAAVPIIYEGKEICGGECGSFRNTTATGDGALFMLPALAGGDENLSSTRIRAAIAAKVAAVGDDAGTSDSAISSEPAAVLAAHGYSTGSVESIFKVATAGAETVGKMLAAGKAREQWVSGAQG